MAEIVLDMVTSILSYLNSHLRVTNDILLNGMSTIELSFNPIFNEAWGGCIQKSTKGCGEERHKAKPKQCDGRHFHIILIIQKCSKK